MDCEGHLQLLDSYGISTFYPYTHSGLGVYDLTVALNLPVYASTLQTYLTYTRVAIHTDQNIKTLSIVLRFYRTECTLPEVHYYIEQKRNESDAQVQ